VTDVGNEVQPGAAGADRTAADRTAPDGAAPDGTGTGVEERRALLLVWAVLGVAFLAALWSRRWMSDDGFINLRIVENIVDGHGPVFNVGERVEAGTSQLWLLALVVPRLLLGWLLDAEWIAVLVGIGCSLGAVAVVARSQWRTWRGPVVPVAILAWLPLGAVWDFSSSGLEGPLLWLWLAACFGALSVRAVTAPVDDAASDAPDPSDAPDEEDRSGPSRRRDVAFRPWWLPVLLGLGPLIRPDAALYSVAFLAVLVVLSERRWRGVLRALVLALALPVAYEVFRMGFFGALVPNTALAKEAGGAEWSTGARYLFDFSLDGWLWIPLIVLVALGLHVIRSGAVRRRQLLLWTVVWGAALVHVVWVVRVGGDFMHARLLLPDWFLLLLPLAALPPRVLRDLPLRAGSIAVLGLALWAAVVWSFARQPLYSPVAGGVMDERTVYVWQAGHSHPVTLEDHSGNRWTFWGTAARDRAEAGEDVVLFPEFGRPMHVEPSRGGTYIVWPNIGMLGYSAGPDVHVVDPIGLSDAFAARMDALPGARIGHAKDMPRAWTDARFGDPDELDADARMAGRALSCPALQELQNTTTAPLTPRQFALNVLRAPSLTSLQIPRNPHEAVAELC
jgi:arabinofuranosyltransferase